MHPVVKVPVVVREQALAVDEGVFDGNALGEYCGVVISAWVWGAVSRALGVGAYGGVPVILAIARVLPVNDECCLLGDCGRHEDDATCSFPEFLGGVNEFMVAI